MFSLTTTELAALRTVRNFIVHMGRTPSVRELMKELGYKSPRSASLIIEGLIDKQFLKKKDNGGFWLSESNFDNKRVETVNVPLIGTITCGFPTLTEENIEAMIPVSVKLAPPPQKYFLLHAYGDSMNQVDINKGDLLLIHQQQTAENGDIVVACIDGETTIKEYWSNSEVVILKPRSTNVLHKPIILNMDFLIQGILVKVIPNFEK